MGSEMRWTPNFAASLLNMGARRLLGTAMLSGSALLLEIALTRVFSLLYYPPYVFFIISIAILGIGIGAALPALRPALLNDERLTLYCGGATLSTVLLIVFAAAASSLDIQLLLLILLVLPYAFFGLTISCLFTKYSESSRILYMSDLVGAGAGALLTIPLLNSFGAVNAVLLSALGFSFSGLCFARRRNSQLGSFVAIVISVFIFGLNAATGVLDIDVASLATEKPIVSALSNGGKILDTRWDAFARTDLVDPGEGRPLRVYVDGGAASVMPAQAAQRDLMRDIGFFPFATDQPERVFIIGPGAGLDVWFALQSQAQHITAVEVNGASVEIVESWRAYNGDIYTASGVEVVVDDGRSVLGRSRAKYDLIYLSQVVTLAAERGGYALSENTIYTVDAFSDYLAHLGEGGQIALKLYDEVTLTRALSTALSALRRHGLSDQQALKHLMAFVDERSDPPIPLLLVGASAFSEDDSLVLGAIARQVGFAPLLLPHVLVQPPLDAVDSGDTSMDAIIAASDVDISPPTDDRPYFFQFETGIPTSLIPLCIIAFCLVAGLVFALIGQLRRVSGAPQRFLPAFFAMLGVGFIAIEIYAIQQTRLFLGHPTVAVTLVLATFLVGGGIGSGLSQGILRNAVDRRPQAVTAAIALVLVLWSLLWTPVSRELVASPMQVRGLVAVLSLLPLALCMGIPFPQALATLGRADQRGVAFAWSVNGLMTVAGTIASVVLSITLGFSAVLWLGGGAYLLGTLILMVMQRRGEDEDAI